MGHIEKYVLCKLAAYSGSNDRNALMPTPLFGNVDTGKRHPGAFSRDYRNVTGGGRVAPPDSQNPGAFSGVRKRQAQPQAQPQVRPAGKPTGISPDHQALVASQYKNYHNKDFGNLPPQEQNQLYKNWLAQTKGGKFAHKFIGPKTKQGPAPSGPSRSFIKWDNEATPTARSMSNLNGLPGVPFNVPQVR